MNVRTRTPGPFVGRFVARNRVERHRSDSSAAPSKAVLRLPATVLALIMALAGCRGTSPEILAGSSPRAVCPTSSRPAMAVNSPRSRAGAAFRLLPGRSPDSSDEAAGESPASSGPRKSGAALPDEAESPLDLSRVDVSEARRFQFHGRADVTYAHFASSSNVDGFRADQVVALSPGVYGEYRLRDWLFVVAEIEYDGLEESIEVDQAVLKADAIEDFLTVRLGRYYFPFGLEKEYYSPSRNRLVDRPAAFRQIYPGTYADNGVFVEGKYTHHTDWTLGYEAAVTQGLRGFDREDGPKTLRDNNGTPQIGGRLHFRPRSGLTLGTSYTIGFWDDDNEHVLDFFGVDARLDLLEFELRTEYVGGRVQGTPEFTTFFRHGWYVHLEREFEIELRYLHSLVPVFRVDWINSNDESSNKLDLSRYSFGLATFFLEHLQLKLEFSVSDERGREISNNGFLGQLVFDW